jgi:hypothetical protein
MPQAVIFITCIREVPGSNLNRETGYPDADFSGFPQFFKANTGIETQVKTWPLPSTQFLTNYSVNIDAI